MGQVGVDANIKITGLAELNRALRKVDDELPKDMRRRLKAIADKVAGIVAGRLPRGPDAGGHMADRTRGRATGKTAGITWSSRTVPYAGWVEFGGSVGPGKRSRRPFVAQGRYIFPTVEAHRGLVERELQDALEDLIRKAGLD